jgi:uncharacterized membrane protein
VTAYDWALLLHLAAVITFFSGLAVAASAQLGAWRRQRAGEVAAVLALARVGALLVAGALVFVVGSGLWLVDATAWSLDEGWLAASLALLLVSLLLGAIGGRRAKRARLLATTQPPEAPPSPETLALLRDRASLAANLLAAAAAVGILVLMVWRPT